MSTRATQLDRRRFLRIALGTAGAVGWSGPAVLAGFGAARTTVHGAVRLGLGRARQLGKPLLVLFCPSARAERERRERMLCAWLADAADSDYVELAQCEVVCGTNAAIRAAGLRFPRAAAPIFAWIEPGARTKAAEPLDAAVPEQPELARPLLQALVRRALGTDAAALERRAEAVRATFNEIGLARVRAALEDPARLTPALADRAAAWVRAAAATGSAELAKAAAAALARGARARLEEHGIRGAAYHVELPSSSHSCLAAFAPNISRSFLHFYLGRAE